MHDLHCCVLTYHCSSNSEVTLNYSIWAKVCRVVVFVLGFVFS
uniref:Uncharacterized protein n=1 Tax=Rhizophora mucronata TaxID=61149 RepID=A0A2P2Q4E9_RHIMU